MDFTGNLINLYIYFKGGFRLNVEWLYSVLHAIIIFIKNWYGSSSTSEQWTVENWESNFTFNAKSLLTNGREHLIATHKIEHLNFECFVSDLLPSFELIGMVDAGVRVPVMVDQYHA